MRVARPVNVCKRLLDQQNQAGGVHLAPLLHLSCRVPRGHTTIEIVLCFVPASLPLGPGSDLTGERATDP